MDRSSKGSAPHAKPLVPASSFAPRGGEDPEGGAGDVEKKARIARRRSPAMEGERVGGLCGFRPERESIKWALSPKR